MRHISLKKKKQFLYLIAYQFVVGFISLILNFNALWYLSLSWILPTIFFLYKLHTNRHRYILEALLWSIPGSLLIDWIGHYSRAWAYWDNPLFASTGLAIFGIPIESFIWGSVFWIFYVVVYEYFFDENRAQNFNGQYKILALGFTLASLALVVVVQSFQPEIPFFFLLSLSLAVIMFLVSVFRHKELIPRIIKFGLMVFVLGLQVEYFSLQLGLWDFPDGDFISQISYFGHLIPLEEVLWWLVVPMGVVAVHEVFVDNHK